MSPPEDLSAALGPPLCALDWNLYGCELRLYKLPINATSELLLICSTQKSQVVLGLKIEEAEKLGDSLKEWVYETRLRQIE